METVLGLWAVNLFPIQSLYKADRWVNHLDRWELTVSGLSISHRS